MFVTFFDSHIFRLRMSQCRRVGVKENSVFKEQFGFDLAFKDSNMIHRQLGFPLH